MGVFDKLGSQRVFEKSAYFQPGKYLVDLELCKYQEGYKGKSFIIEAVIVDRESSHADAPEIGSRASHVWKADGDKEDIAKSTMMQFLLAACGEPQSAHSDEEWATIAQKVFGPTNALAGTRMVVEVFMTVTKRGQPFTAHRWLGTTDAESL